MRSVVSYTLFSHRQGASWKGEGTPARTDGYIHYLPAIVRVHHALWPGWELWLHHDQVTESHPYFPALQRMQQRGLIKLVPCGIARDIGVASMWRFKPVFAIDGIVFCHDIDSLPLLKVRRCAEEFAQSTRTAMVIHGCESHNTAMAGLFGVRTERFRDLTRCGSFDKFMNINIGPHTWDWYGADESYLRDAVWPKVADEGLIFRFRSDDSPAFIRAPDVRTEVSFPAPLDINLPTRAIGDSFAPYPGAAGFDVAAVIKAYDALGLPTLAAIAECEGGRR